MIQNTTSGDTPLPFVFDGGKVARSIADMLNEIAESAGRAERFAANIDAQSLEYVLACHKHNATAVAKLTIAPEKGRTWEPLEIPVIYPYHGVFVTGNGNGNRSRPARAKLMAWRPCLIRRPGLWFLRHYKSDGSYKLKVEFGFLSGRGISHGDDDVSVREQTLKRKKFKGLGIMLKRHWDEYVDPHFRNLRPWPGHGIVRGENEFIKSAFAQLNLSDKKGRKYSAQVDSILRTLEQNGRISVYDSEDLATRRLLTYEVFLAENIVQYLCNGWLAKNECRSFKDYIKEEDLDGLDISAHIRGLILNRDYRWLVPFACRTAPEALSCLTSFLRHGWKSKTLKQLPPQFRQNHPSFQNIVCPVQTPESDMVGIALNLAKGVSVGRDGELEATPESRETGLGYAASLIPFIQHNDAARASLGAKNYVQAMRLINGEVPIVQSGAEIKVRDAILPLCDLLPTNPCFLIPGMNMLVAYMPWYGYNYNDAIVAGDTISQMMSAQGKDQTFVRYLEPWEKVIDPLDNLFGDKPRLFPPIRDDKYRFHYRDAVVPSEIMVRVMQHDDADDVKAVRFGATGELKSIKLEKHRIEWVIEATNSDYNDLQIGDKLTGRHGNKGVVSEILPDDMMPRLPDDDRLGELSGLPVMLVLNPHGVLSRMNVGQLLESHVGLLKMLGVEGLPDDMGRPFTPTDAEMIRSKLLSINGNDGRPPVIDECGRMTLNITDVKRSSQGKTIVPVVVGFQYFVRLDHSPLDKVTVRGGSLGPEAYNPVTGQPLAGRSVTGGQKLGRMEFWALDAYRANSFIDYAVTDALPPGNGERNEGMTFHAIRDGLFALGIVLDNMNGAYRLRHAEADEIRARCTTLPHDIVRATATGSVKGVFKCKHAHCEFQPIALVATGNAQRGTDTKWPCFADILRNRAGVNLTGEIENAAGASIKWESDDGKTHVELKCVKKYHFDLDVAGQLYHSYTHSDMTRIPVEKILKMRLTCSEHTTAYLERDEQETHEEGSVEATGGLSDPAYFGKNLDGWCCVEIPDSVRVRPEATLGKWAKGLAPITVVPVLPPIYRKDYINANGEAEQHKLTRLYIGLLDAIRDTEQKNVSAEEKTPTDKKNNLENALAELYSELKKRMETKSGLMRGAGLSRRMDRSGRTVAVPDPRIRMDECRMPEEFLSVLFGMDEDKDPQGQLLVVRYPTLHRYNIKAMYASGVDKYLPNSVVCVNPLVCKSMGLDFDGDELSLFDVPEQCEEDADHMYPTCGENLLSSADGSPVLEFEQDMVTGSYLMSLSSYNSFVDTIVNAECETCMSFIRMAAWDSGTCRNLQRHLCLAHGSDAADSIHEWMRRAFEAVTNEGVSFGYFDLLECMPTIPQINDKPGTATAAEIEIGNELLIGSLKESTEALDAICDAKLKAVISAWKEECVRRDRFTLFMPGIAVAIMVVSGARGKRQIRQLLTSRGYLPPGAVCFEADPKRFFFEGNLVAGMNKVDYFWAAMNGRATLTDKKLSTMDAGSLTNDMATVCWPWRIQGEDCGNGNPDEKRRPSTCGAAGVKRVCRKCYGKLADGSYPEDDYPAGLVAAQSIGERGTQLSMKGFQTGATEVDIEYVKGLMNITAADAEEFTRKFLELSAYENIYPRHFEMLWLSIKGSEAKTLSAAVRKMGKANVFNAMTGPHQWQAIKSIIKDGVESAPTDMLARIMVGKPGVEVAACANGSEVGTDESQDEIDELTLADPSDVPDEGAMEDAVFGDETGQERKPDNEDEIPQSDSDATARKEPGTDISEISIIRVCEGETDSYSVECCNRTVSSGNVMRMASAFAHILVKGQPKYENDKEMSRAIAAEMGVKEDGLICNMVSFLKRTALYADGRRIPLKSFIAKRSSPDR